MRKMQNNKKKQQSNGHLRKSETQAEARHQRRLKSVKIKAKEFLYGDENKTRKRYPDNPELEGNMPVVQ
jgi:hypothetical protein